MSRWLIRLVVVALLAAAPWWCWYLWEGHKPAPSPAQAAVLRPHAIARLATWGKRDKGLAWGIVALPDTGWHNGDTMILTTDRAKKEGRP